MKRFAKIVNSFLPLTIFTKRSILDAWQSSQYASDHILLFFTFHNFYYAVFIWPFPGKPDGKHQVILDMHYTLKYGFGFHQPPLEREFVELLERQLDIEFKGKCTSIVKFNPGKPCYITKSIKELKLELRKLLKRSIVLSFILTLYILLGAFLFFWIENCLDLNKSTDQANYLQSFGSDVQDINKTCREILKVIGNYSNTSIVETDFTAYDNYCQNLLYSSNTVQNFTRSCSVKSKIILEYTYFTLLSVLTIGYRSHSVSTTPGQLVMIIYLLLGIPLAVVLYQANGNMAIITSVIIFKYVGERFPNSKSKKLLSSPKFIKFEAFILLLFLFILNILLSSSVTSSQYMENFEYSSSIYFWAVTLMTIGDGNLNFDVQKHSEAAYFMALIFFFMMSGLSIFAAILKISFIDSYKKRNIIDICVYGDRNSYCKLLENSMGKEDQEDSSHLIIDRDNNADKKSLTSQIQRTKWINRTLSKGKFVFEDEELKICSPEEKNINTENFMYSTNDKNVILLEDDDGLDCGESVKSSDLSSLEDSIVIENHEENVIKNEYL